MTPGYEKGTAESGTGSHRRRVALLEAHLGKATPKMFAAATDGVVGEMTKLARTIGATLQNGLIAEIIEKAGVEALVAGG